MWEQKDGDSIRPHKTEEHKAMAHQLLDASVVTTMRLHLK